MSSSTNELLTVAQMQERVNLNSETLLRLAREGKIPCVKVNARVIRFAPSDVIAALAKISVVLSDSSKIAE
jgi:excisionase family DNA binding protein